METFFMILNLQLPGCASSSFLFELHDNFCYQQELAGAARGTQAIYNYELASQLISCSLLSRVQAINFKQNCAPHWGIRVW
jgi:hypothetical protein